MLKLPLLLLVGVLFVACADTTDTDARPSTLTAAETPNAPGSESPGDLATYEDEWTDVLSQAVTDDGLVRYDRIKGDLRSTFDSVVAAVETRDPATLETDAEKLAFWMNAYNVKMIEQILAADTPDNIEAYGSDYFFKTPFTVAGQEVTLDQIENVILRRQDGPAALEAMQVKTFDPRIHVGLNCGAISCPRLRQRAFTAENVDAELDRAMRDFVNSPRHFQVEGETITVSSLLDWFAADWGTTGQPAGDYLLGFLDAERPNAAALRDLFEGHTAAEINAQPNVQHEYRWKLNAVDG